MRFTGDIDIERNIDWVEVTENDGICHPSCILWGTRFEDWEMRDRHFVSNTNSVEVHFHTDGSVTGRGWRLEWGEYERNLDCVYYKYFMHLSGMVGDEESRPKSGVLTSPNYPAHYPNHHDSTQTVKVAEGKTIRYVWTNFHTEGVSRASPFDLTMTPPYDTVEIVDEDGTSLQLAYGSGLPSPGTSNTNIMHVKFHTDENTTKSGWRLEWNEQ